MFRVIIAGGRYFCRYQNENRKWVYNYALVMEAHIKIASLLCDIDDNITIVSGTAEGADKVGEWWGENNDAAVDEFIPDWEGLGKSAGYIRNSEMADNADALIAFWDGESKGTKHMIDLARKKGLKVRVVHYNKN